MKWAYYNEFDPFAAEWLRKLIAKGLIAPGDVDTRSILDVHPDDVRGYTQAHFFAGIGGWSYALRLAGWADDRPVWTGSCPCQPYSSASRLSTRHEDDRNLWPVWSRLIAARMPRAIFGEQVPDAGDWLDFVCDDLETLGYEVGASVLPACSVGFDHIRHRIYFAGHTNEHRESGRAVDVEAPWLQRARGESRELATADGVSSRVGQLRAYGNAIVPQVAAEFVAAFMECRP